jgi:RND family efflux transporter MFP subunit
MVQPGMVVANVVDISKLKVKLNVAEQEAFKLKVGDPVEVTTDVYPGVAFEGKVATVSAKGDGSHSYPVEITLLNSKRHPLKAGMFGRVTIKTNSASNALVISKELVLNEDTKPIVFTAENGVARERTVKLGARSRDSVQILEGLSEGELVVSFGQRKLKDGSAINAERSEASSSQK